VASHGPGVLWGPPDPVPFEESRYLVASLTAREREVAALVSAGLSNREIADKLFLNPRTVEYHIRWIYSKLDVRSRVQLANVFHSFNTGLAKATPENTKVNGEPEKANVQEPYLASPEQIEDLAGYALKPDPLTAKTLTDLERLLRALWAWAGHPSSRILAARSGGRLLSCHYQ
jgi:DNA-binding CsgD family transcriptional regulator